MGIDVILRVLFMLSCQDVSLDDAARFESYAVIHGARCFILRRIDSLECERLVHPRLWEENDVKLIRFRELDKVYDVAEDCANHYSVHYRLRRLHQLRELLGEENWFAARLPNFLGE